MTLIQGPGSSCQSPETCPRILLNFRVWPPCPHLSTFILPGFASDSDSGPGKTSPEFGDILEMPDFVSDFDPGPVEPSLQSGVSLEISDVASDFDPGPGKLLPESGDMFPENVTFPCLDTLTSAVSGPRHLSTSATGDASLSDDSEVRCPSTSTRLAFPCDLGGTPGT